MRSPTARSRWSRRCSTACLLALLLLGQAIDTRGVTPVPADARGVELTALDSAHARLSALMDAPANARSMRDGVRGIQQALSPALRNLRDDARSPAAELEHRLSGALSQLDDEGAALAADRSEFVLSALVPIASALDATRDALAEKAP